jgi:hypothetical protein
MNNKNDERNGEFDKKNNNGKKENWKEICKGCEILRLDMKCSFGCDIIRLALKTNDK